MVPPDPAVSLLPGPVKRPRRVIRSKWDVTAPSNPSPRKRKYRTPTGQEAEVEYRRASNGDSLVTDPVGYIESPEAVPPGVLDAYVQPPTPIFDEMLKELIRSHGTNAVVRMLGFKPDFQRGKTKGVDVVRLVTERGPPYQRWLHNAGRSIWFLWSMYNCPSNLTQAFHLQTWGAFNPEYKEHPIGEVHAAGFEKRLRSWARAKRGFKKVRPIDQKRAKRGLTTKHAITIDRRRQLLPKHLRSPRQPTKKRQKQRRELLAAIREQELQERYQVKLRREKAAQRRAAYRELVEGAPNTVIHDGNIVQKRKQAAQAAVDKKKKELGIE